MFRGVFASNYGAGATASAGTEVTVLIPPRRGAFTRLTKLSVRMGGTAHTIVVLKSLAAPTTVSSNAAGAQAVVNITADSGATPPGAIAANDYCVVQLDNGSFWLGKVSSVSSLAITFTANLPSAAAAGNNVWFMGAVADHPVRSQTNLKVPPAVGYSVVGTVSILNTWGDGTTCLEQSNGTYEPLVLVNANATAASTFEEVIGVHTV